MKKFAGSLVLFVLVIFLCSSNLWAGDSEIRKDSQSIPTLPLTIPAEEFVTETEAVAPAVQPDEVMTDTAPAEPAAEEAVEAVEPAPEEVVEEPEAAIEPVVEEVEQAVAVEPPPAPKDDLTIAAELIDEAGLENLKKALDLCMDAAKKEPNSYKANWMAAQACRLYGMEAQEQGLSDWKDTCKLYGKKGMAYAEKAVELEPNKVEGHFWYGMNVGIYSDSVSILTALKEGLKDKTQNSFETAYKIDKYYEDGGAIAALGRFWSVLPWPLNDDDKSMEYFREYQKTEFFGTEDNVQVNVYFAELLMDSSKTKDEAMDLLKQVPKISANKYWNDKAKALLEDM